MYHRMHAQAKTRIRDLQHSTVNRACPYRICLSMGRILPIGKSADYDVIKVADTMCCGKNPLRCHQ